MNLSTIRNRAFTLIELLVVMAVMAVFLGIMGLAISGGGGTVATQAGQRTLMTMIASARSQAVLNQTDARLIMHVDPPSATNMGDPKREKYLRFMAILVRDSSQPTGWRELDGGVYLPKGIFFVPPPDFETSPKPTTPLDVISPNKGDWSHDRRSWVAPNTMEYAFGHTGTAPPPASAQEHYMFVQFGPRGTAGTTTESPVDGLIYDRRIIIAPATQTATYPTFEDESDLDILGGMIRRNGSLTLVNEPLGFPEGVPPPP